GLGRSAAALRPAGAGVLRDEQPLAFPGLAGAGPRPGRFGVLSLAYGDAYAALARPPRDRGQRTLVSRPVQVVSGRGRRALLHGPPLRRAQRPGGGAGEARRGLALRQLVAVLRRAAAPRAEPVARAAAAELAADRERAADRRRR